MDNIEGGRRREVVEFFRASRGSLTAREVADELGLHINTVRFHLDALVRHGTLRREEGRSEGPGRPRTQYLLTPGMDRGGPRNFKLLAEMLLSHLASEDDADGAAARAGQAWGRYLVPPPAPSQRLSSEDGLARLTDLLSDVGFDPQLSVEADADIEIRLRHCPFLELAETHRELVCALHLGLMQGALEQLGIPLRAQSLTPFADPHTCLAHLVRADTDPE
ncbi:MAG: helix-turn-helix domain-containing protein [Jatrophihabitantaceae bacterium]